MKKAFIVPHPPIILPEVGRGEEEKISETIKAFEQVAQEVASSEPETIIISSPHAPFYGKEFYLAGSAQVKGNLEAFGVEGLEEWVSIDQELSQEILKTGENLPIYYSAQEEDLDHGSLIPLRFIKAHYKDFKLVLIGISSLSAKTHYKLGMAVAKAAENLGRKCLYIASGDLSHVLKEYGPYGYKKEGPAFDEKILDILQKGDFEELLKISKREGEEAAQCGLGSFQIMAGFLDGYRVEAKKYSYQGPFGVGYAVFSFTSTREDPSRHLLAKNEGESSDPDPYIELARTSIEDFVKGEKSISLPINLPKDMIENRAGCFVTIHKSGQLRGCIGTIGPVRESLAEEIVENAISAAMRDPRFPPVRENELDQLDISVDVLEQPEPIESLNDLDAKTYGVIVSSGNRRGLLLPNLEGINTPSEQIAIALQKAGISAKEDFQIKRFKVIRHEYNK